MSYVYQVSISIKPEEMSQLAIGGRLERVLGYLRTLLPSQSGFVTARAMNSIDSTQRVEVVFESEWRNWEDLLSHRESNIVEAKVISEFAPAGAGAPKIATFEVVA